MDPDLVYVTTHLAGSKTRFLPFNRGKFGGAGNPPVPLTQGGYATAYLWEDTWARDSVLELVRQFIQEVEEEDDGRKTGKRGWQQRCEAFAKVSDHVGTLVRLAGAEDTIVAMPTR